MDCCISLPLILWDEPNDSKLLNGNYQNNNKKSTRPVWCGLITRKCRIRTNALYVAAFNVATSRAVSSALRGFLPFTES